MPRIARKNRTRLSLQRRLLVGVRKICVSKVIGEFDDVIVINGNMSRVISCACRGDSAVFVFMIEIEELVGILFIEIIVLHDLKDFFKFFDEVVIISRSLEFQGQIMKISTSGFDKRISRIQNTQHKYLALYHHQWGFWFV